jgi:hypothetical protein
MKKKYIVNEDYGDFGQEFLKVLSETKWFDTNLARIIHGCFDWDSKEFKRLDRKFDRERFSGFRFKLTNGYINQLFIDMTLDQAFVILFANWIGFSMTQLSILYHPEWTSGDMVSVLLLILHPGIPDDEIR